MGKKIKKDKKIINDTVSEKKSSVVEKKDNKKFSLARYIGKFVAFLGIILVFLYFLVWLFKKGVFSRTKLGFLNSTKNIQVLSNTYISPKRSLMMVKVQNQIFLLANSESGIQFLSEIDNVSQVLKDGELALSGSNFDTNLTKANSLEGIEEKIKLKESDKINESKTTEDRVRMSDQ